MGNDINTNEYLQGMFDSYGNSKPLQVESSWGDTFETMLRPKAKKYIEQLTTGDTTLQISTDDRELYLDFQKAMQKKRLRDIVKLEKSKNKENNKLNEEES